MEFEGDVSDDLLSELRGASSAVRNRNDPPRSLTNIRRRGRDDVGTLTSVLHSEGYYDGSVEFSLKEPGTPPSGAEPTVDEDGQPSVEAKPEPAKLVFTVDEGPRFTFDRIVVNVIGTPEDYQKPALAPLGLVQGAPARADTVINAESEIVDQAKDGGRAFAKADNRRIIVDREAQTMDVTLNIDPGPLTPFGNVDFQGAKGIDEDWLEKRVNLTAGEAYSPERLRDARKSLTDTGLFSTVRAITPESLDGEDQLPVTFDVTPRKSRTIGFGAGYQTDEGLFGRAFWENRNIFGAGERLRIDGRVSQKRQNLSLNIRKPDTPFRNWDIVSNSVVGYENTDAFERRGIQTSLSVERPFGQGVTGSLGIAYRLAEVQERGEEEDRVALLFFPARLDWDFSDNLLDPTKGGRVLINSTPFYDTSERGADGTWFFKNEVTHTRYFEVIDDPRLVLAFRGRVGSIYGASREDIPADERFYAGGGGSVRGIPFQKAGPLDEDDDPIGGRSLLELSGEIRYRITPEIGLVAFVDAGTVYDSVLPDFDNDLEVGVGPGLRYITPIGPLRVDVGFPVNRRKGVDDLFQLYVSIGQAF